MATQHQATGRRFLATGSSGGAPRRRRGSQTDRMLVGAVSKAETRRDGAVLTRIAAKRAKEQREGYIGRGKVCGSSTTSSYGGFWGSSKKSLQQDFLAKIYLS
ncbi:hypothetical protein Zmor_016213 [Zophobas morio]|uniref:Uncharacterized protein n=1 Tax=Zophobas morio TaxID=2755281 RepID=A0AA38IQ34_9CUCU|nr:hypothetical protein Zmor_016213 [Zophobas morio]